MASCTCRLVSKLTFERLIASTPRSQSFSTQQQLHTHLIPLFRRYGFPLPQLHDFLSNNPFLLNYNPSQLQNSLRILLSFNLTHNSVVSMLHDCPRLLEPEFLNKWEPGIRLPHTTSLMIQNVLQLSTKFDLHPGHLSTCVQRFQGLGFSGNTITRVLEAFPMVIMMRKDTILGVIEFLLGIGIHRREIDGIFYKFPRILAVGVKNKLNPLVDEFKGMGCSLDRVRKEILRDPGVLGLEVGEISKCLKMLRNLKCRIGIKEKIFVEGAFRAAYEVKLRVDCLHKHGLIYTEAFKVLWKEPRAILYHVEDIEKKIEFLVNRMKFDVIWVVDVPEYLGMNFEKQIVPRYNVIEYLRSNGGLGDEVGLKSLIKPSRLQFYNLYVKPYPECEKLYGRFAVSVEVRNQHPVGMWKLFKPQKYPQSKVDAKNIKSFMEQLG